MAVTREIFNWTDPESGRKYKDICTVPQFVHLLENVIEEESQAESFFKAYSEVSKEAEHNVGYLAGLIKDKDVQDDVLDLFLVELQVEPKFLMNKEYSLSPSIRNGSR